MTSRRNHRGASSGPVNEISSEMPDTHIYAYPEDIRFMAVEAMRHATAEKGLKCGQLFRRERSPEKLNK